MSTNTRIVFKALAVSVSSLALMQAAPTLAQDESASTGGIAEIIVTAQKVS